jgi:putative ABC transport system permease protein
MLKNYITIALRNLIRQKAYTAINIAGLATGMACCFLIFLFVSHELGYDKFQGKAERIYQVEYEVTFGGNPTKLATAPPPIAPLLNGFFPEIETSARVYFRNASLQRPDKSHADKYEEENFGFADSTLTDILTFHFIAGNPQTALDAPFSIIISDEMARKYFGQEEALGKTLLFDGTHPMKVSGVFRKYPDNSHIHPHFFANYETMFATSPQAARGNLPKNWVISHSYYYVLLKPGYTAAAVNARFPAFLEKFGHPQLRKDQKFTLIPLLDIHLRSDSQNQLEPGGDIMYVYVFTGIAMITLLIACINFINLATASSLRRTREVGVRKVLGAYRWQLIWQFLGESILLCLIAFSISIVLVILGYPSLMILPKNSLSLANLIDWRIMAGFIGVFILTGLVAGSYPAFFVSGFESVVSLKGTSLPTKAGGVGLRKVLVVMQFAMSITLIAGALVAFRQLEYLRNRPAGFWERTYPHSTLIQPESK